MGSRTVVRVTKKVVAKSPMGQKSKVPKAALCQAVNEVFCEHISDIKQKLDDRDWDGAIYDLVDFKTSRDMLLGAGCTIKVCPKKKGRKAKP